jgi:hypothetical protein
MLKETRSLLSSGESAVYFSLDDPLFRGLEARKLAEMVRS